MTHWLCTYDPDDGVPIGEECNCDIGDDHNGKGEPVGLTFTTAARSEASVWPRNDSGQHSFSPYAICQRCGLPFALAAGPCSPLRDEGPVPRHGDEQALIHEHPDGLPDGPDREPGPGDQLSDGRDSGPGRVGPVLDAGADDAR
jgi:hypothetical protein